jgi:hypothetical protein
MAKDFRVCSNSPSWPRILPAKALVHESIAVLTLHRWAITLWAYKIRIPNGGQHARSPQKSVWTSEIQDILPYQEAENAFYRYKRIIGGRLRAKNENAQKQEAAIGCTILNRMLKMGEPLSYAVG